MEKVRIFQELLEYIYALTPPTRKFVKRYFSKIAPNWFEKYVYSKAKNKSHRQEYSLSSMDLPTLVNTIISNWEKLKRHNPNNKKFNGDNLDLLKKVIEVRNQVAHLNEKRYTKYIDFQNDKEIMEKYAKFLGVSLSDCVKRVYEEENKGILDRIFKTVSEQSLAIEKDFPPDIAYAIRKTKETLDEKKTSKEIIDFLNDALASPMGQKVAAEIHKRNLPAFEDIAPEIFNLYYGFIK